MSAPRTYETLRAQIARKHAELSDRLRRIAEFAVQNPNDMALETVASLAGRIGVQPSSIIRFANSFGYDGFSDMQTVFRSRLVADAAPSYRERIQAMRSLKGRGNGSETSAGAVLSQFIADDIGALEDLHNDVAPREIERAAALLMRARSIFLVGQRRSFPVAFYLHYALSQLDLRSFLIDSIGGTIETQARAATRDDVLIAISFKDYAPEVVRAVETLTERKVPLITITDAPFSPIAGPASVTFELPDRHGRAFRSLVAPMCLAQSLVVTLGHQIAGRA
jgi:DNA-binding MurR/RpiR family transcriptional regulator